MDGTAADPVTYVRGPARDTCVHVARAHNAMGSIKVLAGSIH